MKEQKFLGLVEDKCWIPLTAQFIDASNIMINIANNDDKKYCIGMYNVMLLIEPMYSSVINFETLLHFLKIFIYCLEFEFGDPYAKNEKIISSYVTPEQYFKKIKKNWNVDIDKKIKNINNKTYGNKIF